MTDQDRRAMMLAAVEDFSKAALQWGYESNEGWDIDHIKQVENTFLIKKADLLTLIDELVDDLPGFSPFVQDVINSFNDRQKKGN